MQNFSVLVVADHGIDQTAESVHSTPSVSVSGFFSVQAAGGPLLKPSAHDVRRTFQKQNNVGLPHLKHKHTHTLVRSVIGSINADEKLTSAGVKRNRCPKIVPWNTVDA